MNFLHRTFHGRIAKPRQVSNGLQEGDASHTLHRSPPLFLQTRAPDSRAGSGIFAPALVKYQSSQHQQSSRIGATTIPVARVKIEDEEDGSVAMALPENYASNVVETHDQHEIALEEMNMGHTSQEAAPPEPSLKEEPSEEDGSMMETSLETNSFDNAGDEDTDEEEVEDQSSEDHDAVESQLTARLAQSLSSDEPIPSIEEDDRHDGDDEEEHEEQYDEEEDKDQSNEEKQYQPRDKTLIYLHGARHPPCHALDTGIDRDDFDVEMSEIEDESFEQELRAEVEEDLLIDDIDLRHWLHHKRATAEIETWPSEACRLYKLLFLRGLYPMFASDWQWNLSDHPVPDQLFTPRGNDNKCLLKPERRSRGYAWDSLRMLFKLHINVQCLRLPGPEDSLARIAPYIKKGILDYVRWAERDGGFFKKRDYISPVFVIAYKTSQAASTGQPILEKCQKLVDKYRSGYAARNIADYPRCIYIFVVVQHVVLIMVADTIDPDGEEPYPLAELDLSQRSHWLDYSLAICTTVLLAKEALVAHRSSLPEIDWETDDPDA